MNSFLYSFSLRYKMETWWIFGGVIILLVLVVLFIPNDKELKGGNMKIQTVFENNQRIPVKYTCDGEDVSPEIIVSEIPEGTKTLALISDDPDAPSEDWVHWLLWNIPVTADSLAIEEGTAPGISGRNSFRKLSYGGPCPPSGTHRYFFKVYALNTELELQEGSSKEELENAMQEHMLDKAEIIGLYSRGG
jgi:hypothetical protein